VIGPPHTGAEEAPTAALPSQSDAPPPQRVSLVTSAVVEPFDAVIFATGFRHKLHEFLEDHSSLLGSVGSVQEAVLRRPSAGAAAPTAASGRMTQSLPLVDGFCRSTVISSIYFVGIDFLDATLSLGPVLGYRGYDVGAQIAHEIYGKQHCSKGLAYPSLPASAQHEGGTERLPIKPKHAASALAMGVLLGMVGAAFRGRGAGIARALPKKSRANAG